MDADTAKQLRAPFPADAIGKLPRVTCKACSDSRQKHCDRHQRAKCRDCGNYISTAHIHLDYAGHAAVTDRLIAVDPTWTWEPVAFGEDGLPVLDRNGGLWIRLTVAGVTRLGYGDAEGKAGPSAVKEAIGDALRNGAMRFGVGLDLWHKDGPLVQHDDDPAPAAPSGPSTRAGTGDPTQARAALAHACEENGWDLGIVADLFVSEHNGTPLGGCTDALVIAKFRSSLFGRPQASLMPATNGAPQ